MAEILYVHKPGMHGDDGEPQPTSDLKHAQSLGYQRCKDQNGARDQFKRRQAEAAGEPADVDDTTPSKPKAKPAVGVTETTNNAAPGGAIACPFDDKHGPFRSQRGLDAHLSSKHPGQMAPAPQGEAPPA